MTQPPLMSGLSTRRPPAVMRQVLAGTTVPRRIVVRARSSAAPAALWTLLADTRMWASWAPHITGVVTAEPGVVRAGQHLRVAGPMGVAVPATVTLVDAGRRWDFRVDLPGPWSVMSRHEVRRCTVGSEALVTMWVRGPGGRAAMPALMAYRPIAEVAVRRLARMAGSGAATSGSAPNAGLHGRMLPDGTSPGACVSG